MKEIVVVAIGGNYLDGSSTVERQEKLSEVGQLIASMRKKGAQIAVVHGSGPQIGEYMRVAEEVGKLSGKPSLTIAECTFLVQERMGYEIKCAIDEALAKNGLGEGCKVVKTKIAVDGQDPAFLDPSKPVGPFYNKAQAEAMAEKMGWKIMEDAGRGYRRAVASPKPVEIVELEEIKEAMKNDVVVCCGGGGVPVILQNGGGYQFSNSVIDKDLVSSLLADSLDANKLLIVTGVANCFVNFGKPSQRPLGKVNVRTMTRYMEEGQFAKGSMLPKVKAAIEFAKSKQGRISVITDGANAFDGFLEKKGTIVFRER